MALTVTDLTNDITKPLNAVFNQTLLRNARVRAPYFAGTVPGTLVRNGGSNVMHWRRIDNLSASTSALSETTTAAYMQSRTPAELAITPVTATMARYGNFVILNEEVQVFNYPGQFDKILEIIGINAGKSLNQLQRNIGEDNLTAIRPAGAGSDGAISSAITKNAIQNAVNAIDKNSAMTFTPMTTGSQNVGTFPMLPAFWGLTHPDVAIDIANLAGFVSVERYAGQISTVLGEFGALSVAGKCVRFVSSEDASVETNVGATGGSSADLYATASDVIDVYNTLIYGQDCMGSVGLGEQYMDGLFRAGDELGPVDVIVKTPGQTGTSDPYNEITTVAWKAWHTGAVLNSAWGRRIRSAATDITN